ncbi:8855_t:CDS:1, partial [Paraglomus brasilianum]
MRLQEHYLTRNFNAVYISLASYKPDTQDFDEFWKLKIGSTWMSISSSIMPTRIIVDEAQVIYGGVQFFWGTLKVLSSTLGQHDIRVLLLGTYHPTYNIVMPMTFPDALGLSSLRLTQGEFGKLVGMYVQKRQMGRPFNITKSVEKVIFNFACGYVGICRTTLTDLYQKFPNSRSPEDMLKHLASRAFLNRLLTSHALYWVHDWQPKDQEADFLHKLLLK